MAGVIQQTADKVPAGDQLATLQSLLTTLGGNKTTTTRSAGDTSGISNALASLQANDPAAQQRMLEALFQQAAGSIPGFQAAYGNAIGARSGNNAAVAAALQNLLKQTTVAAQDNMAKQQLQGQQLQVQAGKAMSDATGGTTVQKSGTDTQRLLGTLALLQAATKLTGSNSVQDMVSKFSKSATASTSPPTQLPTQAAPGSSLLGQPTGQFSLGQSAGPLSATPEVTLANLLNQGGQQLTSNLSMPALNVQADPQVDAVYIPGVDASFSPSLLAASKPTPILEQNYTPAPGMQPGGVDIMALLGSQVAAPQVQLDNPDINWWE